jgi:hypothetical protein
MKWSDQLWATIAGEQDSLRLKMYYAKKENLYLPVEVVAGKPRVLVNAHVMKMLNSIDEDALRTRLKDGKQQNDWRTATQTVRANEGKTVSINAAAAATVHAIGAPERATISINIYLNMYFKVDELRRVASPDVIAALAGSTKRFLNSYEVAELLGIEMRRSSRGDGPDQEATTVDGDEAGSEAVAWDRYRNLIFFGPPGTGKSYKIQQIVDAHLRAPAKNTYRVTFHPEFSYFDFVGTYKPRVGWMKSLNDFTDADGEVQKREPRVYYAFEPGPFSRALVHALLHARESVVVIVEEINRGNCAAIFGDVFQLLDRVSEDKSNDHGCSEYPIVPSAEWKSWLDQEVGAATVCWRDGRLRLPSNLYLYATMNTSDQSLFPMDTAFRRRWGLEYVGVETTASVSTRVRVHASDVQGVEWIKFTKILNELIVEHTRSDDKQMGAWFVQGTPPDRFVTDVQFRSKVLFYLWSEVFRDSPSRAFHSDIRTYDQLVRRHADGLPVFSDAILERLRMKAP